MAGEGQQSREVPGVPEVMREFLYADIDRARSIMSQRVGGVPEEDQVLGGVSKRFDLGIRNYLGYSQEGKTEEHTQRSLLDALLPELEAMLEAEGWLKEITQELNGGLAHQRLQDGFPPGCIVKFTADGQLFDPEFFAQIFTGISVTISGIEGLVRFAAPSPGITKGVPKAPKGSKPKSSEEAQLEDSVQEFSQDTLGVSPEH